MTFQKFHFKYMKKKPKRSLILYVFLLTILCGVSQAVLTPHNRLNESKLSESYVVSTSTITSLKSSQVAKFDTSTSSLVVKKVVLLTNQPKVEMEIRAIADELNFKWPDYLVRLASLESSLNPNAVSKPNRNGTIDRGLFQFNSKMPPVEITEECAMSTDCSTRKAIEAINAGKQDHWVTNELAKRK